MSRLKKIFTDMRVIILIVCLILALLAISPRPWNDGLAIRSVVTNSSAAQAGISNPQPTVMPVARERVLDINGVPIKTLKQYTEVVSQFPANTTFILKTNKDLYKIETRPVYEVVVLNKTETITHIEEVFNETTNMTENVTITEVINKTLK